MSLFVKIIIFFSIFSCKSNQSALSGGSRENTGDPKTQSGAKTSGEKPKRFANLAELRHEVDENNKRNFAMCKTSVKDTCERRRRERNCNDESRQSGDDKFWCMFDYAGPGCEKNLEEANHCELKDPDKLSYGYAIALWKEYKYSRRYEQDTDALEKQLFYYVSALGSEYKIERGDDTAVCCEFGSLTDPTKLYTILTASKACRGRYPKARRNYKENWLCFPSDSGIRVMQMESTLTTINLSADLRELVGKSTLRTDRDYIDGRPIEDR